jgi:hypothetical protein
MKFKTTKNKDTIVLNKELVSIKAEWLSRQD